MRGQAGDRLGLVGEGKGLPGMGGIVHCSPVAHEMWNKPLERLKKAEWGDRTRAGGIPQSNHQFSKGCGGRRGEGGRKAEAERRRFKMKREKVKENKRKTRHFW